MENKNHGGPKPLKISKDVSFPKKKVFFCRHLHSKSKNLFSFPTAPFAKRVAKLSAAKGGHAPGAFREEADSKFGGATKVFSVWVLLKGL